MRITARPGETFLDRMIALVEGADRQKTPNEIALSILLAGLTIIFLLAVVTLQPFAIYSGAEQSILVLVALLVCLIPTTIGGLLSAIGIAGMDRLVQRNVLAMSGRAVEAAGDVTTLLLDKTGTITFGARQAAELHPGSRGDRPGAGRGSAGVEPRRRDAGGSIDRQLAMGRYGAVRAVGPRRRHRPVHRSDTDEWDGLPGVDGGPVGGAQGGCRHGAPLRRGRGRHRPDRACGRLVEQVSRDGATPLVVTVRRSGATADPRRDPPQGHGQAGHDRTLRPDCARWASAPS